MLEGMLTGAGFEKVNLALKEESKKVIAQWMPGSGAENHVISADVTARKPASTGAAAASASLLSSSADETPELIVKDTVMEVAPAGAAGG